MLSSNTPRLRLAGSRFLIAAAVFSAASLYGQGAGSTPDLSGNWELHYDSRNVPAASLTPAAANVDKKAQAETEFHTIRWCNHVGMPFMMDDGGPLDIRQNRREVVIANQAVSPTRHIYIDGRNHPEMDAFDPNTLGNSIGRWRGDTLIVDTVGLNDQGITRIPGGGYRTEKSHLIEQYQLLNNGAQLKVTFTWMDPDIFTKPHTYAFMYHKLPADLRVQEWYCDPANGARARFLIDPPQPPPAQ